MGKPDSKTKKKSLLNALGLEKDMISESIVTKEIIKHPYQRKAFTRHNYMETERERLSGTKVKPEKRQAQEIRTPDMNKRKPMFRDEVRQRTSLALPNKKVTETVKPQPKVITNKK